VPVVGPRERRQARLKCGCSNRTVGACHEFDRRRETEIVVLGLSIEWSKRAIYRHESPLYKVTYVTGGCEVYCGQADDCAVPGYDFKCVPTFEQVKVAVLAKLP